MCTYNIIKHIFTYYHQIHLSHISHTSIITYCIYTNYHIIINVTQCKTCDSMHVVPNVNPMFHRFPIQYLESKPHLRSGQDQGHQHEHIVQRSYFQLRIKATLLFQSQHVNPKLHHLYFKVNHECMYNYHQHICN